MIQCKVLRPSHYAMTEVYAFMFEMYPEMDPHEFATAYVNHVAKTGHKPEVWNSMECFWKTGKVA